MQKSLRYFATTGLAIRRHETQGRFMLDESRIGQLNPEGVYSYLGK